MCSMSTHFFQGLLRDVFVRRIDGIPHLVGLPYYLMIEQENV